MIQKIIQEHRPEQREEFDDRRVLEEIIIPYILENLNPKTILDIGREEDQKFYNKFYKGRELWTLDIDPKRKEFGAKNHITDSVANLNKHFKQDKFDLIIMNGVFGWGLNEEKEIEDAFKAIYDSLKKGGIFVFGWNNLKGTTPIPIGKIKSLKQFKTLKFPPLKTEQFESATGRHTYNFYTK